MDPSDIETADQFGQALNLLRGSRSYAKLGKAAAALPVRDGRRPALPSSTLSDLLTGKSSSLDTITTYLTVCGVDTAEEQRPWLEAYDGVAHQRQRGPAGAVRVRYARPRVLGVHAAIQADAHPAAGWSLPELPVYVPRDVGADLRTRLTAAAQQGGFVLLTGGSSVGKTRAMFEAIKMVTPDWWLLHPADTDALRQFALTPIARTVVWLDELQNYLDHRLPAATVRDLVSAGVVVVATLWPDEYTTRSAPRTSGQLDPYANDRQVLALAHVVPVSDVFSPAEQRRAEELAGTDPRICVALDTPDAGFTQVMAAGPELVRWWEQAPDKHCYGKAVITAALDARRVGARGPATREFLQAAAPGYLTCRQRATAPADWLDQALTYATTPLHGATATLCPLDAGMGHIAGYQVADYLHQHARCVRRTIHLPDTAWQHSSTTTTTTPTTPSALLIARNVAAETKKPKPSTDQAPVRPPTDWPRCWSTRAASTTQLPS